MLFQLFVGKCLHNLVIFLYSFSAADLSHFCFTELKKKLDILKWTDSKDSFIQKQTNTCACDRIAEYC